MLAPLVGVTPMYMVCFLGYGVGKQIFTTEKSYEDLELVRIGLAGATSGVFTTPLLAPLERIKCILQIQENAAKMGLPATHYKGAKDCGLDIYRKGGLPSLFRGFWATMARDCVASFFYFSTYAYLRHHLTPEGHSNPSVLATLFAGGCAGITNWLGCMPIDTLKSRYQTAPEGKYNGIRSVLREVLQKEGVAALYRGIGPTMIRAFPANAACFLGVESAIKFLRWIGL